MLHYHVPITLTLTVDLKTEGHNHGSLRGDDDAGGGVEKIPVFPRKLKLGSMGSTSMKSSESCRIDINFGHVTSSIVQDGEFLDRQLHSKLCGARARSPIARDRETR